VKIMNMPAPNLDDPGESPVALHDRAIDDLRFIRETMVRSGAFTAISGWGVAGMGAVAVGAFLLARGTTPGGWVSVWIASAVVGFVVSMAATILKAKRVGEPLTQGPGRRLILGAAPALAVGGLLTLPILQTGRIELLPTVWILLYGTAVTAGGAFSVRPVPLMGLAFLVTGGATLLLPTGYENATMLAAFGGLHLIFGTWIARRHGG
jgi:hypothetical protein